ncbi:MAG: TolC family protein, partial [Polyangiales bacterium]
MAAQSARGDDGARTNGIITLQELLRAARNDPPAVLEALATLRRIEAEHHAAVGAYLPRMTAEGTLGAQYDNRSVIPGENINSRIDSTSFAAVAQVNVDWTAVDLARKHDIAALAASTRAQDSGVKAAVRAATMAAVELYVRA